MQNYRTLWTFLAALVCLGGCCPPPTQNDCASNISAGVPIIHCQPEDNFEAKLKGSASFSVVVDQPDCRYQWYREDLADGKVTPLEGKPGWQTANLSLPDLSGKDSAKYFCSIVSAAGLDTRSRSAELYVGGGGSSQAIAPRTPVSGIIETNFIILGNPQYSTRNLPSLPVGGMGVPCNPPPDGYAVTTSQRFPVDDSGGKLHSPAGANVWCSLHLESYNGTTWTPAPTVNWFAKYGVIGTTNLTCVAAPGSAHDPACKVVSDKDLSFVVYIKSQEAPNAPFRLTVTWLSVTKK